MENVKTTVNFNLLNDASTAKDFKKLGIGTTVAAVLPSHGTHTAGTAVLLFIVYPW